MFLRNLRQGTDIAPLNKHDSFFYGYDMTRRCLMYEIQKQQSFEKFWQSFPTITETCLAVQDLNITEFNGSKEVLYHVAHEKNETEATMVTISKFRDEELEIKTNRYMPALKHYYIENLQNLKDLKITNKVIDQLFCPVDSIASQLIEEIFQNRELTICQINLHIYASSTNGRTLMHNFLRELVTEGRFLPIVAHWKTSESMRIFFLNIKDKPCQDRYFYHAFAWKEKPANQTV